jgi:hypothetical protein
MQYWSEATIWEKRVYPTGNVDNKQNGEKNIPAIGFKLAMFNVQCIARQPGGKFSRPVSRLESAQY